MNASDAGSRLHSTSRRLELLAAELVSAYRRKQTIEAPSRALPDLSEQDALALAEAVRELRIASGDVPVGYKVGFTNAAVRAQFGAPGPLAATVYRQTLATDKRVVASELLGPRIEPEVVVGIGADGAASWAAFGFEIVQSHVADWNFGYLDAIADFGLHAALIVGQPRPLAEFGPATLGAMRVRLLRNGVTLEYGAGADVDGGPLESIAWLQTDLKRVSRGLLAGELVSTGSLTRVPAIHAGERWTIEAFDSELPPLTIDVD